MSLLNLFTNQLCIVKSNANPKSEKLSFMSYVLCGLNKGLTTKQISDGIHFVLIYFISLLI